MDENCHLFGPGLETMADYLSSCNLVGQPTRKTDDTCILDSSTPNGGAICGQAKYCPKGCSVCDATDKCDGYVETGCSMTTEGTEQIDAPPTVEGCQAFAVSSGDNIDNIVTFFTFSIREEECRTYYTGKRNCQNLVARQTLDIANINNCQTSG